LPVPQIRLVRGSRQSLFMAYIPNPVLTKDILKLRLSRLTRAKLVAECFDTLNEFLRVPLSKWKIQVANLDDEEVEEIIAFLKKHGLEHRVKK